MQLNIKLAGVDARLVQKRYYHGLLPREDVIELLRKNGQFVLRVTEPTPGDDQTLVLSTMHDARQANGAGIKHYLVRLNANSGRFWAEPGREYATVKELVDDHVHRGTKYHVRPVKRQVWELENWRVDVRDKLGEGAFGAVCKGTFDGRPVAIKQALIGKLNKDQLKECMAEARVMRRCQHPNIVRLYGVAALDEPLMLVMELAAHGSLDSHLRKHGKSVSVAKKMGMCLELAWALDYLRNQNILHRDVAARNCLLCDGGVVKLSDFGKTQPGPVYAMDPAEILPIRWLAPETMREMTFTFATDLWSYGIACWEVFADAQEPYTGYTVAEVNDMVVRFQRMAMPDGTPPEIVRLVHGSIWTPVSNRISIDATCRQLEEITNRARPAANKNTNAAATTSKRSELTPLKIKDKRNKKAKKKQQQRSGSKSKSRGRSTNTTSSKKGSDDSSRKSSKKSHKSNRKHRHHESTKKHRGESSSKRRHGSNKTSHESVRKER